MPSPKKVFKVLNDLKDPKDFNRRQAEQKQASFWAEHGKAKNDETMVDCHATLRYARNDVFILFRHREAAHQRCKRIPETPYARLWRSTAVEKTVMIL